MTKIILEDVMPHRAPLLLVDEVISYDEQQLTAAVVISETSYGYRNGGVPSWFGVEYMAQSIAAYNGLVHSVPGVKPQVGFLVGVRNYDVEVEKFVLDSRLEIIVHLNVIIENSGVFDCEIRINGESVATAKVTTYKPTPELIEKMYQRDL